MIRKVKQNTKNTYIKKISSLMKLPNTDLQGSDL
jgi:hypothetical protein